MLMDRLLKRFWTFEPETMTLRYVRKATDDVRLSDLNFLISAESMILNDIVAELGERFPICFRLLARWL